MKIAIYSPYLDTFGGGERYMMTMAQILSSKASVDVLLDNHLDSLDLDFKQILQERFDLDLSTVEFIKAPLGKNSSFFQRWLFLKKYDLMFYLTDGSIFYPGAKRNILHIQTPLVGEPAKSIWGKIKLKTWDLIIYNSKFTRQYSQKNWPLKSEVIYPPVDVMEIKPLKKEKYILSVGRFFGYLKSKKHDILIKTFAKLYRDKNLKDWSLHLVGSSGEGDMSYLEKLKKLAKNLPVHFYPNLEYGQLKKLYGKSLIYWHAAGYGEGDPTKMEHFGISTVEAMAGGCVPIVIKKGGQLEIVTGEKSGFLWDTIDELENLTLKVIRNDKLREENSMGASKRAQRFSKKNFIERIKEIISD